MVRNKRVMRLAEKGSLVIYLSVSMSVCAYPKYTGDRKKTEQDFKDFFFLRMYVFYMNREYISTLILIKDCAPATTTLHVGVNSAAFSPE